MVILQPHPLTNFEMKRYQNKPRFNGVYSRNGLPKIKMGHMKLILIRVVKEVNENTALVSVRIRRIFNCRVIP